MSDNSQKLTNAQIAKKQAERAMRQRLLRDRAMHVISLLSLPCILIMVGALIFSAQTLPESRLAVVSGLVSSVTIGLISILQRISGAEKEDPMVSIAKDLIAHLTEDSSKEFILDDKSIRVTKSKNGTDTKIVANRGDLVHGRDKK